MNILCWNVNGLRARIDQVKELLHTYAPAVMCIQEPKIDHEIEVDSNYTYVLNNHVNKGRHGVLTLVRKDLEVISHTVVETGRVSRVELSNGMTIYNCYINQGQEVDSSEYFAKLDLMELLLEFLHDESGSTIICGDFNIIPEGMAWCSKTWNETINSCTPKERALMKKIPFPRIGGKEPTWFGYRTAWRKYKDGKLVDRTNKYGVTCDHVYSNLAGRLEVLTHYRLPEDDRQSVSDHIPLNYTVGGTYASFA